MKTPREVILRHHQAAEARLATIRAEDLAAETNSQVGSSARLEDAVHSFWRETFWPWRRVWIGVGIAWAVIITSDISAVLIPDSAAAQAALPGPEAQAALQQQEQLLTQLLGTEAALPAQQKKPAGPRSAVDSTPDARAEVGTPRPGVRPLAIADASARRPYGLAA